MHRSSSKIPHSSPDPVTALKNRGGVLRASSTIKGEELERSAMLRSRRQRERLWPSFSTVGCVGVLSPLPEPLWAHTHSYPSRPAHPPCPLLGIMRRLRAAQSHVSPSWFSSRPSVDVVAAACQRPFKRVLAELAAPKVRQALDADCSVLTEHPSPGSKFPLSGPPSIVPLALLHLGLGLGSCRAPPSPSTPSWSVLPACTCCCWRESLAAESEVLHRHWDP